MKASITISAIFLAIIFFISCDKDVSTTPEQDPIYKGTIVLDSEPEGARIFMNGDNTGKVTPDSITHLEPGNYNIEYWLDLYLPILGTATVEDNSITVYYKNFYEDDRNYGSIKCYSSPENALIAINDVNTDRHTPFRFDGIWPGFYKITCSLPEHRDTHKYITVYGGQNSFLTIYLQDTSLCVDYNMYNSDYPSYCVSCVEVDDNGIVWVGNNPGGIARIENGEWAIINPGDPGTQQNSMTCLELDNQGNKWFGTKKGIVRIDNNNNLTFINDINGIELDYISDIKHGPNGVLYVISSNSNTRRHIWRYDGTNWVNYDFPGNRVVLSLCPEGDNQLWVGLDQGLMFWENGEYRTPPGNYSNVVRLKSNIVHTIKKDSKGNVWFGTAAERLGPGGLFFFDGTDYNKISLSRDYVTHLSIDDEDNILISCYGRYGISPTDELTPVFIIVDENHNITYYSTALTKIATGQLLWSSRAPNGTIWIGSRDKGIIKFKIWNM